MIPYKAQRSNLKRVSDIEELNKVLEKAVNLRNMLKNKERVERIANHVAEHYREPIEPLAYKAFLVAVDREACAVYKTELDKHLPKEYSEVVYSPVRCSIYCSPPIRKRSEEGRRLKNSPHKAQVL